MKEFTDDEKIVARNIDKKYKWIARDKFDNLFVFNQKPHKNASCVWVGGTKWHDMFVLNHMFKLITWEDAEPTLIRDIYDPQILSQKTLKEVEHYEPRREEKKDVEAGD